MARLRYNGVETTLGSGLTDGSDTSIDFAAVLTHDGGTNVPTISSPDYIPLSILDANNKVVEIVYLTAYTAGATTGTITRAREGTSGAARASGLKVVHAPTVADQEAGRVIAAHHYNPGTLTLTAVNATTDADVDATNLAITFTVPASGVVIAEWSMLAVVVPPTTSGSTAMYGTWRESSSSVTGSRARVFLMANGDKDLQAHVIHGARITGLTPGDVKTWKVGAWKVVGSGGSPNAYLAYGDDSSSAPYGPAVLTVTAGLP